MLAEEIETPGAGQIRALVTVGRQPGSFDPGQRPTRRGPGVARLHGVDRHLRERDDAPRRRDPPAARTAREGALRRRVHRVVGSERRELLARDHRDGRAPGMGDLRAPRARGRRCRPGHTARRRSPTCWPTRSSRSGGPRSTTRTRPAPTSVRSRRPTSTSRSPRPTGSTGPSGCSRSCSGPVPTGWRGARWRRARTASTSARWLRACPKCSARPTVGSTSFPRRSPTTSSVWPTRSASDDDGGLLLVGRRDLRSNNSWMHNIEVLVKGRPRCTLQVHPDDADALGLRDGGTAAVSSRVGSIAVPVEVTDIVSRGTVSLPHGWGHGVEWYADDRAPRATRGSTRTRSPTRPCSIRCRATRSSTRYRSPSRPRRS